MDEADLVAHYPRLWHMAHDGSWPAIREHGLRSASSLIGQYSIDEPARSNLGGQRRICSVPLVAEGLPGAVLRDQKPMSDTALAKCLQGGLQPQDWYAILNSRTFFWLSRSRIWRLLRARAYRDLPQVVLTVQTASLVEAHRDRIWLSPINSGSTLFNPQPRGPGTFKRIVDFPFNERSKTRPLESNVVELIVEESVPDISDHVLAVHRVRNDAIEETIWVSPRAEMIDRP